MGKITNVLFLCSGNTCRSPFAEYIAKFFQKTKYSGNKALENVKFDSAGLYHYYETPQEGTIKYLKDKGIDINDFQAKEITGSLIENQDIILGFEKKWHLDKLKRRFNKIKDLDKKTFLLLDYAGEFENLEIKDPFDLNEVEYNKVLKRIENGVLKVLEKIINKNESIEKN